MNLVLSLQKMAYTPTGSVDVMSTISNGCNSSTSVGCGGEEVQQVEG
jgi:hypothetical protein